jgi:restriction endonuclease S subunit
MKLSEFAQINYGITFRRKVNTNNKLGGTKLIQIGDIDNRTRSLKSPLTVVDITNPDYNHFTQVGDILIKTKGNVFTNILIDDKSNNILFASPLVRIHITSHAVNPEYLSWYLNSPEAYHYFDKHSVGTTINSLSLSALNEMEIPIPPITQQRKIGELFKLSKQEEELQQQLLNNKKDYYQSLCIEWSKEN